MATERCVYRKLKRGHSGDGVRLGWEPCDTPGALHPSIDISGRPWHHRSCSGAVSIKATNTGWPGASQHVAKIRSRDRRVGAYRKVVKHRPCRRSRGRLFRKEPGRWLPNAQSYCDDCGEHQDGNRWQSRQERGLRGATVAGLSSLGIRMVHEANRFPNGRDNHWSFVTVRFLARRRASIPPVQRNGKAFE